MFKSIQEYIDHLTDTPETKLKKEEVINVLENLPETDNTTVARRGQLAGLTVDQMTDEQLKREIINANSVLYKAKQRGAAEETIARNQARLDAAKAERDSRKPVVEAEEEVYAEADPADEL